MTREEEAKVQTPQGMRKDDIVACGAFGRGTVIATAREHDAIVTVALNGWTLATGESPKMYVLNPSLTMRKVASKTGNDMGLENVVVALAP